MIKQNIIQFFGYGNKIKKWMQFSYLTDAKDFCANKRIIFTNREEYYYTGLITDTAISLLLQWTEWGMQS